MSWVGSKAWIVAASVGAVEALKDQGVCRWNHTIRSGLQHAKNRIGSAPQTQKLFSSSASSSAMEACSCKLKDERARRTEETLRKVMLLSSWGPH